MWRPLLAMPRIPRLLCGIEKSSSGKSCQRVTLKQLTEFFPRWTNAKCHQTVVSYVQINNKYDFKPRYILRIDHSTSKIEVCVYNTWHLILPVCVYMCVCVWVCMCVCVCMCYVCPSAWEREKTGELGQNTRTHVNECFIEKPYSLKWFLKTS